MISEAEIFRRVQERHKCITRIGEGPAPHKIAVEEFGHHSSYCLNGYRVWGFVSEKGRNKFVKMYRTYPMENDNG